jgi:hypothetical protein
VKSASRICIRAFFHRTCAPRPERLHYLSRHAHRVPVPSIGSLNDGRVSFPTRLLSPGISQGSRSCHCTSSALPAFMYCRPPAFRPLRQRHRYPATLLSLLGSKNRRWPSHRTNHRCSKFSASSPLPSDPQPAQSCLSKGALIEPRRPKSQPV